MNLVDKLLAVGEVTKKTAKMGSKRLSGIIGEHTEITIQEISGRRFNDVKNRITGGGDAEYEACLMCCMYGIVEPDLKSQQLQEHFGVHTPKDLCEKLFSAEVYAISDRIIDLSGLTGGEDEVKN